MALRGDSIASIGGAPASPHVDVATPEDARAWDAYVATRPEATVYQLYGWRTVAQEAYGLRTPFLVSRDQPGGDIRGILPLIRVPRPTDQYLTTGLFGAYGPLLADDDTHGRALVEAAISRVGAGEARTLHLKLLGDVPSGLDLKRQDIWVTARLDLCADEDTLWQRLPGKKRWSIRHARKEGLVMAHGPHELDGFYEVLFDNMHRKGAPIHGKKFFRSMLRTLAPRASVLTLRDRGRVVSGAFVASYGDTLYVPFGSSRAEYFKQQVNHLLYWELMRHARDVGCRALDFGSSLRDSSVLDYKLGWKPQIEPIRSYIYAAPGARAQLDPRHSGVADVIVAAWRRLPRTASRVLGPALCRWIA
jgi:FemAB-related protein (PEP-CTERM system-associated)